METKWLSLIRNYVSLLLLIQFSCGLLHARNGVITGKIMDSNDNEPLIGAAVMLSGSALGNVTDVDGNYVIKDVKPGVYSLRASYISYNATDETNIVVEEDRETVVNLKLSPAYFALNEMVVVGKANRENENMLLLEQRLSILATQAVGAKELDRKGVSDAESALTKVSGVSKQEGVKNVFVRGLGDRYNTTYLNGFPIPSEDPEYKNISLDFFGTDIIQSIGVNKVFNSSLAGDVGGALIDITSKELIGRKSLSFDASLGVNTGVFNSDYYIQAGSDYFGLANTQRPSGNSFEFKNSLDPTIILPFNHGFGVSGGRSYKVGESMNPLSFYIVASHSKDFSYIDETVRNSNTAGIIYQDQKGKKYSNTTHQLALANIQYGFNAHNLTYNFMLIHANNQYVGEYTGVNGERNQDSDDYWGFLRRQQTNDNLLITNQLMSDWKLNDKFSVKIGVSYNNVQGSEPDRRENYLSRNTDGSYFLTGSNRQKRFFSQLKEKDFNAKLQLAYKLNDKFNSNNSNIRFGYNGRFLTDDFESVEYNFTAAGGTYSVENLKLDNIYNAVNMNSGKFKMTTGDVNSYNVYKYIHAFFLDANYQLTSNFVANIGLKADKADVVIDHRVQHVAPGSESINKFYLLPALNLKYDLSRKHSLRLGLSKTYTLPHSKEISPYQYVNIGFSSQGNAKLKPSDNYNADLKWDFYLSSSELISLTGFYKHIVNPIARVDKGNSAGLLTYDNISKCATAAGVEVDIRKDIMNLFCEDSGKINRLSAGLNFSYIHTKLTLNYVDFEGNNQSRNARLEGAAPIIVNFDISHHYAKNNLSFINSLVLNYFSNRVHTTGMLGFKDIVEEGVSTLDFVSSSKISKNTTIKLKLNNLLDPAYCLTRQSTAGNSVVVLNEFRKGMNVSLGMSYAL